MKFIVSSSSLLKHLQQINGVINANTVLPILEDFLFEIEKNITPSYPFKVTATSRTKGKKNIQLICESNM